MAVNNKVLEALSKSTYVVMTLEIIKKEEVAEVQRLRQISNIIFLHVFIHSLSRFYSPVPDFWPDPVPRNKISHHSFCFLRRMVYNRLPELCRNHVIVEDERKAVRAVLAHLISKLPAPLLRPRALLPRSQSLQHF